MPTTDASTPAAPAPLSPEDLLGHVRLACVPGIGARLRRLLLDRFGSPQAVFAASVKELGSVGRIGPRLAASIPAITTADAEQVIETCRRAGIGMLVEGGTDYPGLLSRIDDPPGVLFVRGTLEPCDALAVAVVGARTPSPYGKRIAWQLAGGLARAGYTVISGLARGIDAAAHRGALDAGGRTIAVLGTGVLNVYPPEHGDLAAEVIARGAVVSEAPPHGEPHAGVFPQRNRIVSGLSLGTVVVEAAERSGALITARLAGEQGREVFAVPGQIDCRTARGCHRLIRDGATLVESVDDILEELGPLFERSISAAGRVVQAPAELRLGAVEEQVLAAVDASGSPSSVDIDEIVAASGLAASQVLSTIGVLEMRRILRRLPGNRVGRT
ncbi:MAG: DNA-processing protein DprA [Planctomycetaceae bacterium]